MSALFKGSTVNISRIRGDAAKLTKKIQIFKAKVHIHFKQILQAAVGKIVYYEINYLHHNNNITIYPF